MTFKLDREGFRKLGSAFLVAGMAFAPTFVLTAGTLDFKPGYNFYSPHDDVQVGLENSAQVEKQLPLLNDPKALEYLNDLGKRLASFAPNNKPEYKWQFKIVNSNEINAFALPGGFIYVNRGVFDAAENEAQLAGVISHEEGHVVMRHGTHIASQAVLAQGGVAIIGGLLGQNDSTTSQLAQLGLGVGVESLILKNSRAAEAQADQVGTYVLYQAGYDPHAMAEFFQTIQKRYPQRTVQFFSDHPNPENRIKAVDTEIAELGPPRGTRSENQDFEGVKAQLARFDLPAGVIDAPKTEARNQPPAQPSMNFVHLDGKRFALNYPDNWQVHHDEDSVLLYPEGGMVTGSEGETAQAYGATVSLYTPREPSWGLVDATQELIDNMRQSNPQMHVLQQSGLNLRGNPALSVLIQNESPLEGQRETDHLVTVRQGGDVLTFIFIAPAGVFDSYAPTFDQMVQSISLPR
jgi:Zn-dependent protease with chaperone function